DRLVASSYWRRGVERLYLGCQLPRKPSPLLLIHLCEYSTIRRPALHSCASSNLTATGFARTQSIAGYPIPLLSTFGARHSMCRQHEIGYVTVFLMDKV